MKAEDVLKQYGRLEYKATDGKFYPLNNYYPICLSVGENLQNEEQEVFYLDTGGPMESRNFFQAKITSDMELYRKLDNGKWKRLSPEIRISNLKED